MTAVHDATGLSDVLPGLLAGVDAVRADGGLVHIRPVRAGDAKALRALHKEVSGDSLYLHFFAHSNGSVDAYIEMLVRPASNQRLALTAWIDGRVIGVAAFERLIDDRAEVALLVSDRRRGEGVGTLLLEHLADAARHIGIRQFEADVLAANAQALKVFADLGYQITVRSEGPRDRIVLDLFPDAEVIHAIGGREQLADAASLRHILAPTSVAVIGAGDNPASIGHQVLDSILQGGFTGSVFAVNPRHETVLGVPCVPSADRLPQPVDLAIIAVPAARVPAVVRDCGRRGVSGLLLLTAGYAETGEAGLARQRQIVGLARRRGMRVVGPNCLGVVNTDPAVRLNATFASLPNLAGPLGLISQSGALGIAVIGAAASWGLGLSTFVSVGNKADVSSNDLLLRFQGDNRTRVIALYIESFGNPRKFARIARSVSQDKPIIAIKAGRSAAGQRAGQSHTAAAASSDVVVDALFTQAGVLRVDTIAQMLDAARVLCDQPLPRGGRVAVVGNSGGPGILAADALEAAGLTVAELSAETMLRLRRAVPTAASLHNPVDLGAGVRPEDLGAALRIVLDADEIDAVMAIFTGVTARTADEAMAQVAAAAAGSGKPVIATRVGAAPASLAEYPPVGGLAASDQAVPIFTFPEPAAAALAVAVKYARIKAAHRPPLIRPSGVDDAAARRLVAGAMGRGQEWLDSESVAALLTAYAIPLCPQRVVRDAQAAVVAATDLGYPLAAKVATPGLHKTDIGGVRLGIGDEADLRRTFTDLAGKCPGAPEILLQPMQSSGTEVIIGAVQHDQFGPAVMVGAGGVMADLIADRVFRLAPLTADDAEAMIDELRTARLLDGYRGAPVVDKVALSDLLVRVAALADDLPEVAELDLNPVLCDGSSLVVVDARIRIAGAAARMDPVLRRLK